MINKKKQEKYALKKVVNKDELEKYAQSAYFKEKDRKAIEFLKKHPIPDNLFK